MPLMNGMLSLPQNITDATNYFRQKQEFKAHPTLSKLITTSSRCQKITQADRIHKSTTEWTKVIRNEPSKNNLKHIDTLIKMRMLLQEQE